MLCRNNDIIDALVSRAEAENISSADEWDYYDNDGLLCCGKCHTRKEVRYQNRVFPCMCECHKEKYEQEQAEFKHKQIVLERKQRCFSHDNLYSWTFKNDNGKQPKMYIARNYVDNWDTMKKENAGLLFFGSTGTGKSYCAFCIANALCEKGISVKVLNLSEAFNDLFDSTDKNVYIHSLTNYSLLIIDDFGAERESDFAREQAFNIVDNRIRSGKPLIITTNLSLDEMKNTSDLAKKRIYDRILSVCKPVVLDGASMRSDEAKERDKILRSLLLENKSQDSIPKDTKDTP